MTDWHGTLPLLLAGQIPQGADEWDEILDALHGLTDPWTNFSGVAWTATGTTPSLGNGTLSSQYMRAGKLGVVRGRLDMGSSTTYGTGIWNFSLPFTLAAGGQVAVAFLSDATGQAYPAVGGVFAGKLFLIGPTGNVGPTVPFTWANTDNLGWTLVGELA